MKTSPNTQSGEERLKSDIRVKILAASQRFGKDPITKGTIWESYLIPNGAMEQMTEALAGLIHQRESALLDEVEKRIIGEREREYSNLDGNAGYWEKHGRNEFRVKQHQILQALRKELASQRPTSKGEHG